MTLGVYGLVAGIVKLDDLGLWFASQGQQLRAGAGSGHFVGGPWLMKACRWLAPRRCSWWGGGILVHGIPVVHHAVEAWAVSAAAW